MRVVGWKRTLVGLLLTAMVLPARLYGQVALTTVQDTVYSANGVPAQGTVLVSWPAFTTANGSSVAAGSTSVTLGAGGALSIALAANGGATPTGSYYTAVFHLSDGTTSRQFWTIPVSTGTAVKLAAVESQVLPASVAMQTVSKSYVDNAIARALAGGSGGVASDLSVLKAGDAMTGPLQLAADPVSALQAADKNYVDTSVAQVASGLATKISTVPTATQTVMQPAGTQMQVNSLNGVLDASGFLSGSGNNGFANALASAGCTTGCEVRASGSYPGTDGIPVSSIPSGGHVTDARGGARNEVFVNPLGVGATSYLSSSVTQITTKTAQQTAAARPGVVSTNGYVSYMTHLVPTGGSNLFPASHEAVPYGKSNYGVLQLTGTYNTQGQHVQFNNDVNCFSVGDCLAGGQFVVSAGGYRDEADEGTHPFDLQVSEDARVFQGTCGSGCTTGSTMVTVNPTAAAGTQGDGRFLLDKNPAKVISVGSIAGSGGDVLPSVQFSGTSFPVSVFLTLAQGAGSQAGNLSPGTVTLPIATSGVQGGFATSTTALPASAGVACVADVTATGVFPNFETATYTAVDGTHLQLTLNKVHYAGATVAVGGLCGYGLEQTVDTVNGVRQVFPVVGSKSATQLYYAGSGTTVVGYTNPQNTSGFLSASVPIASAVRNGNVVTLTTGANLPYDLNGLSLTVSGVADASFDGSFPVTTTGGNTLTYADAGANGSSAGGMIGMVTGGFNLYPMAEVLSVYHAATASVDGTMTLAANTVAWAAGDAVEEPHYYQQLVGADTEYITQYLPKPIQYSSAGKTYQGTVGPGTRGWQISNAAPASSYLGAGGTHQPPDAAYMATGVWRDTIDATAGEQSLLRVHCNLHGCNRWDSGYAVLSMDSHQGQDFLFYDPNSNTASWNLGGTGYSFSPQALTAPTVNATTVNATAMNTNAFTASAVNAASLGVSGTATLVSGTQVVGFDGGAWINMPTSGPSGLGSGGPGANPWIAYASAGGDYFQNANSGDIAFRNVGNALLFGNDGGSNATMRVAGNAVQFGTGQQASFTAGGVLTAPLVIGAGTGPSFQASLYTPASSGAACSQGQFADDANYHYVCVATNTWKRVALSSF